MRSGQGVTWRGGRRALGALGVMLGVAVAGACASSTSESGPATGASRASGESLEQHCADGRLSLVDVAAHRRGQAVVVTWGLPRMVAEPRTYRVLRRPAGEPRWRRVGQTRLPVDAARRYVDRAAPPGSVRYAVVEVDECGAGPVCSPTGTGHRCAVATVAAVSAREPG